MSASRTTGMQRLPWGDMCVSSGASNFASTPQRAKRLTTKRNWALAVCASLRGLLACTGHNPTHGVVESIETYRELAISDNEPIAPIPTNVGVDTAASKLGRDLFKSPLVSDDGKVACTNCHYYSHGLAMDTAFALVPGRPQTPTNATGLFNLRFNSKVGWLGKFDDLFEHNDALLTNSKVIGSTWEHIASRLNASDPWRARFAEAFVDGVTARNVRQALVEYEYSLVTPNAPFDRWLRGESRAISQDALEGYSLFKGHGCVSCHQGTALGGNMFAIFGVFAARCAGSHGTSGADLGRFTVTHREQDKHVFRVPSLRNVALTAPYFHDGSAATLEDAISAMAACQLGERLSKDDIRRIAAFLTTLSGEFKGAAG